MSPRPGMARIGQPLVLAGEERDEVGELLGELLGRQALPVRRSASAVSWSVPGARPMPRSTRPGCSASRVPNCSATTSGAWLGSITPPEPTRMVDVDARQVGDQHGGRGAGDRGHVVVLGDPEPAVAQLLGAAGQLGGLAQGLADGGARGDGRQVKDGQGHVDHAVRTRPGGGFFRGLGCWRAELPGGHAMTQLDSERYYAQIESSTAAIAALVDGADLTMPIPTCPEWTLRQLATHVGRAHRWAAAIVGTRSAEFIPFRSVPDGRLPDDPAAHAAVAGRGRGAAHRGRAARRARTAVWAFRRLAPAQLLGPADVPRDGGPRGRRAAGRRAAGRASTPDAGRRRDRRVARPCSPSRRGPSPTRARPRCRRARVAARARHRRGPGRRGEWLLSREPDGVRRGAGPRQGRRRR